MSLSPLDKLPETSLKINRALLSVSDKRGIADLGKTLHEAGVELISTGGTARHLRDAGLPVTDVSDLTGYPESLDGRVKTLHPVIHAAILGRTSHDPDREELKRMGIDPIELVVVNLYPFRDTVSRDDCTPAIATEHIDIGGPTMIRSAAKNFAHVTVLTEPGQYDRFLTGFSEGGTVDFQTRRDLARQAFAHTAGYDAAIVNYFNSLYGEDNPPSLNISLPKSRELRYGENPHQPAAAYGDQESYIDCFHGKQLSYNNLLDLDAALNLMADFTDDDPTCAIFKHTVPCGVAKAPTLAEAWKRAFSTDTKSPFGGIIIFNRTLDRETASALDEIFTEIVIAPEFSDGAKELLTQKKNRRLVRQLRSLDDLENRSFRSIFGGALSQQRDSLKADPENYRVVTQRQPSDRELTDLLFAWRVVKHLKSNAIVYARDGRTVGLGTGQTSRVESSQAAIAKAREEGLSTEDTVIASDAFFPFADGVEAAAEAGARAVIQPGGSIRDEEVIEMADRHDMAMIFTGNRHFRH